MNKKNAYHFIGLLLIIVSFSSCSTKKNMTYFRDLEAEMIQKGIPTPPNDHIIRPNDNLYISVKTINPEINELFTSNTGGNNASSPRYESLAGQYINGYQVDNFGNVSLPIMGDVHLAGFSLKEAQTELQKKAGEYLKDASIQVKLLNFKINVLGEVNNPGIYYNYNNTMTILEGIGMANGITEFAGINDILVVRETGQGTKSFEMDLTKKSSLDSEAFYLAPNDVIYVKPQSLKNTRLNAGMYSLFLSTVSTLIVIVKFLNN